MTDVLTDATVSRFSTLVTTESTAAIPTIEVLIDPSGNYYRLTLMHLSEADATRLQTMHDMGQIYLQRRALPDSQFRAAEMAWLQAHREELARDCPGEWIAVDGSRLVAHAPELSDVLRVARESGHVDPFVTAVPAANAPKYFVG